ncbi:sporulation protein Cse60 [Streptococcus ferus]|uniref:sporulation protein Cse60 n=1 Tax=Streptococcus ferus TaxID=1345 RepID=UPI003511FDA5
MKVKTFLSTYHEDIDEEINAFLSENSINFIDIKYNSTIVTDSYNNVIQQYSVLLVYEEAEA